MSRAIVGAVASARLMPPDFVPFSRRRRMTAAQREGRAFENAIARGLGAKVRESLVQPARWIRYSDADGADFLAQPDLFVAPLRDGGLLLLELKLTLSAAAVEEGLSQLLGLYVPLLSFIFPQVPVSAALLGKYRADRSEPVERVYPLSAVAVEELGTAPLILHCPEPARIGEWARSLL